MLLEAIEITIGTVEDRGRLYRNLVVTVSVASILSILLAVVLRQWVALVGPVLLVPLTGGFLFIDSRRIRNRRAKIFEKCLMHGLDVAIFGKTISGFGHLPAGSLQAMLSTISSNENATRNKRGNKKSAAMSLIPGRGRMSGECCGQPAS